MFSIKIALNYWKAALLFPQVLKGRYNHCLLRKQSTSHFALTTTEHFCLSNEYLTMWIQIWEWASKICFLVFVCVFLFCFLPKNFCGSINVMCCFIFTRYSSVAWKGRQVWCLTTNRGEGVPNALLSQASCLAAEQVGSPPATDQSFPQWAPLN